MPSRIVTLLPSATEIVCALGLRDKLAGVTHECDYPQGVETLPHVTRSLIPPGLASNAIDAAVREHLQTQAALYSLDAPLLAQLRPDLIVTQALCDVCAVSEDEVIQVLDELPGNPKLINLEPMTLDQVFDTIELVGEAAECVEYAQDYVASLRARVAKVSAREPTKRPTVALLEWLDPLFNAGHWTPEIIELAGGIDVLGSKHQPSHTIDEDALFNADPEVLVIALCGFDATRAAADLEDFKTRVPFDKLQAAQSGRVYVLDGNAYFSRPGPRLVDSLEILADLLHQASAI